MALSQDQKKHLLIGGGAGALAVFLGSMILGERKAVGAPRFVAQGQMGTPAQRHKKHREKRRQNDDQGNGHDNDRGEYRKKHKVRHGDH